MLFIGILFKKTKYGNEIYSTELNCANNRGTNNSVRRGLETVLLPKFSCLLSGQIYVK